MSMKYVKSGGIAVFNSNLPVIGGGNPIVPGGGGPPTISGGGEIIPFSNNPTPAQSAGMASIALGLMQWMDSINIPNPYSFVKNPIMYGFTEPNDKEKAKGYQDKWNKQFNTLGNGKFDLNDILAFPVNWGVFLIDKAIDKAVEKSNKKKGNNNSNNGNGNSNDDNNSSGNNNNGGGQPYAR